jgi:hypothetical protein
LAGWLTAIVVVFWVAIHGHSVVIAAAAVLYVLASLMSKSGRPRVLGLAFRQEAAVLTATAWVMVTLLFLPQIYTYGRLVKAGWKRLHMPAPHTVSGTPIDSVEFQEVDAISRLVKQYHATVLFSYPIQPFYYSLVPRHATRFITFEPQTTAEEQAEAIEDLKRSKPQLVIMDVRQANGMQKSVGRISDYITENFEPVAEIDNRRPLMVLVPRPASSSTER